MKNKIRIQTVNIALLILFGMSISVNAIAQLIAYDFQTSGGPFAEITEIDSNSGQKIIPTLYQSCNSSPPNVLFSVNFTSGLTYVNDSLYGLEWDGGNGPDIYLYKINVSGGCAVGQRITASDTGFTNLESLAYNESDGFLYSADFDFASHLGGLIRIDPATGVGTRVGGNFARDVNVVGLTYEQSTGSMLAVTSGFATRQPELLRISTSSGQESLIGGTGTDFNLLQSVHLKDGILYSGGTQLHELNKSSGMASIIGGTYNGTLWGLTGMSQGTANSGPVAVFNANTNVLTFSVDAGAVGIFDIAMTLSSPQDPFRFILTTATPRSETFDGIATFANNILSIPVVQVGADNYSVELTLTNEVTIEFTLTGATLL